MSCPINYTCPTVDELIAKSESMGEALNEALELIDGLSTIIKSADLDTLASDLTDACDLVSDINDLAEELRIANEQMREWGEKEEIAKNDLEAEIASIEEQANE